MTLKLDTATTDLEFADGRFTTVSGTEAIAQNTRRRAQTARSEWFLDLEFGVPYLDQIWGVKNPNMATIEAIFKAEIRKSLTDDVVLTALRAVLDTVNRQLQVAYLLETADGEITQQSFII